MAKVDLADPLERRRERDRVRQRERVARETPEEREERLAYHRAYRVANRERIDEQIRQWQREHPEYEHARNLRRKFGLATTDYAAMLEAQGGVCAICLNTDEGKRLAVDHCHETGRIRGLLCTRCNLVIGRIEDSAATAHRMAAYLDHGDS